VALVNDPRAHNPYDCLYTVEYLGNMTDSPLVLYINQPAGVLKRLALAAIKNNEVPRRALFCFCTLHSCAEWLYRMFYVCNISRISLNWNLALFYATILLNLINQSINQSK